MKNKKIKNPTQQFPPPYLIVYKDFLSLIYI
jgi:hypothetical protein